MSQDEKTTYIKYIGPVLPGGVTLLMKHIDDRLKNGTKHFVLLLSTPGGDVFSGLTVYNYLKGIPAKVTTHNIGSVDSVGVVIYCAGENRLSVPHARFLMHGVQLNVHKSSSFEEKQLEEKLKGLQIDIKNIAQVVADTTGKEVDEVILDMNERTVLLPQDAKGYSLVHDIKSELFSEGSEVLSVYVNPQQVVQPQR